MLYWDIYNSITRVHLKPFQPNVCFCLSGEILHWWRLMLPSQQATSYLVRERCTEFTQVMFLKVTPTVINVMSRWLISTLQSFMYMQSILEMLWLHNNMSFPLYSCFPDLLLIFYYWKAIGDKYFVVHHLAALYAYYYVLVSALLSNSRTCRQDGKETTKGEQLCPLTLAILIDFHHHFSKWPWLPHSACIV